MRSKTCLTASDARRILSACKVAAEEKTLQVTIAIVDEGGYLIHLERLDGAVLSSPEVAILKARTAALARCPTKSLEDIVKERPATGTFPGRLAVQGGIPILYEGEWIGGIGVSGAKSHEDEYIATAGLAVLKSTAVSYDSPSLPRV
jgi:glc operon protein GlcG